MKAPEGTLQNPKINYALIKKKDKSKTTCFCEQFFIYICQRALKPGLIKFVCSKLNSWFREKKLSYDSLNYNVLNSSHRKRKWFSSELVLNFRNITRSFVSSSPMKELGRFSFCWPNFIAFTHDENTEHLSIVFSNERSFFKLDKVKTFGECVKSATLKCLYHCNTKLTFLI